jgi:competence ComEA-like helix-hairpin-helix protein
MFNLEKHERLIVICLALFLISGLLVMAYKKSRPPVRVSIGHYRIHDTADVGAVREPPLQGRTNNSRAININTADTAELEKISGIGKALASRIVEHRTRHGLFISKEEIKKVGGIGDHLYEKIKDEIRVE